MDRWICKNDFEDPLSISDSGRTAEPPCMNFSGLVPRACMYRNRVSESTRTIVFVDGQDKNKMIDEVFMVRRVEFDDPSYKP